MEFTKCTKEPAVYQKRVNSELLVIAIYVDDLFVTGSSLDVIKQFKDDMSRRFEMSYLGKLTYYLGIEVSQGVDGILIKQGGYAQGILVMQLDSRSNAYGYGSKHDRLFEISSS